MSKEYFSKLNYSMANEDTLFERELVNKLKPNKILAVCGSGGRALPLIHDDLGSLTCVDLSKAQLLALELRTVSISIFTHKEFLIFWGYAPFEKGEYSTKRKKLFDSLSLTEACSNYFSDLFIKNKWQTILYQGSWESTFVKFSKFAGLILGKHIHKFFSFSDIKDQRKYFQTEFPWKRWNFILRVLGNRSMFNALLYKGHFVQKNVSESYFTYYSNAFKNLFLNDLCRKSFFLQLCFLGKIIYQEGNTVEAEASCFKTMKSKINSGLKIEHVNGDLIETIRKTKNIDYISMSDVPSYFNGEIEHNFLQSIIPSLSLGAVIVIRSYLRVPDVDRSSFTDVSSDYFDLIKMEKVQMYKIEVLRYDGII